MTSQGGQGLLGDQDFATACAMLAFRQAGFSAGWGHGGIDRFFMAQGGNIFLSDQDLTATRAMLALGQTSLGTGGVRRRIDHFCMA